MNILDYLNLLPAMNLVILLLLVSWSYWVFKQSRAISKLQTSISTTSHKRAQQVINNALLKAGKFLESEKSLEKSQLELLRQSLDTILRDNLAELEEIVKTSEDKAQEYFDTLAKTTGAQTEKMVSAMGVGLQASLQQVLVNTQERFNQDYKKAQNEIEEYKQTKIASLESLVEAKVLELAKEILPKSIALEDHYQLVVEGLEKAKKEGLKV